MSQDEYFPGHLVAKGTDILVDLCIEIESKKPNTLEEIYALTHQATERFNLLAYELEEQGSELETVARENIGMDIEFILQSYGYEIDIEEAIAPREW